MGAAHLDALERLAAMCSHVPNKGEQIVRYYDYYSNVNRGKRKKQDPEVIKKILKHLGLWDIKARPPPRANAPPINVHIDYSDSQVPPYDDYLFHDTDYPAEGGVESYAS